MEKDDKLKANLTIKLYANDLLIAEAENPKLWQNVLLAISSNNDDLSQSTPPKTSTDADESKDSVGANIKDDPIQKFADELNVSIEKVQAACRPSVTAPYIHLDRKSWESFLNSTPRRGPKSISRLGLASTLLCFWFDFAEIEGGPTVTQCQAVLNTIGISDSNPSRSLDNSPWIQKSGGKLILNPARVGRAIEVAKFYCEAGY